MVRALIEDEKIETEGAEYISRENSREGPRVSPMRAKSLRFTKDPAEFENLPSLFAQAESTGNFF
jgi:hypothetical protein